MTPDNFRVAFQPYADQAAAGTGLSAELFLAQWAIETGYASSFAGWYNLGNISRGGASNGFVSYTSYAQFVNAEILLLHDIPYEGVLASAGKSIADQCKALGASPWDAGHYDNGGGPGSSLIAILPAFGLSAEQITGEPMTQAEFDTLLQSNAEFQGIITVLNRIYYALGLDSPADVSTTKSSVLAALAPAAPAPAAPKSVSGTFTGTVS